MSTVNQVYPLTAGFTTDNFVPDTALIQGMMDFESVSLTIASNTAFSKYEVAKMTIGGNIVKYAAPAAQGDQVVVVCYDADNLTATAAALRTPKVMCWTEGEFNETKLVYVGGNSAATIKGVSANSGLTNPAVRN